MADIGDVVVKLQADVGQFQTGMNAATTSIQNFQYSAETATTGTQTFYEGVEQAGLFASGSERGIRRMEFALGSLASESLGAGHAVGQLGEGMLLFTAGSPVALGVLAGVFAIGEAIKLVGDKSIDATTHIDDVRKALQKLADETPQAKFRNVEAQIAEANRQLVDAQNKLEKVTLSWQIFQRAFGDEDPRTQKRFLALETLKGKILELQEVLDHLRAPVPLHAVEVVYDPEQVERAAEAQAHWNLMLEESTERLNALQPKIEAAAQAFIDWQNTTPAGAFLGSKAFTQQLNDTQAEVDRTIEQVQRTLDRDMEETNRQMQRWGDRIGRDFARAIMGGFKDMQDLLKAVFEQVLSFSLGRLFGSVFKSIGGFPSASASSATTSATGGMGGITPSVTVDFGKAAPLTAFAVARDPAFQDVIRAAILQARSQGFRIP